MSKNKRTWEDVDKMSAKARKEGKYMNHYENTEGLQPGDFPIMAETFKNIPIGLKSSEEWKNIAVDLLHKSQLVLDGKLIPNWEMLPYRSEKDFRAGIFSTQKEIWPIFINALETDKLKSQAYKIITSGLSIADNQDDLPPSKRRKFRDKTWLCTGKKQNNCYEDLIEKGATVVKDKEGKEYIEIGTNLYPRETHYVMEAKRLGKSGRFERKPYYQNNQKRILDNPEEMQEQIEKWCKQGVLKHLGPEETIKSTTRTSLVLAYHETKKVYRICFDGGPSKVTQKYQVECKLDSIYDAIALLEKGDHMAKLDDKSGFLQIHFDKPSQELSHVKWGKEIFEFFGSIFGVSRVPADFQLVNSCVVSFLRKEGIPITLYLDDRLVIEKNINHLELNEIKSGKRAPRNVWLTHALIIASGGYISKKKSTFVCQTRLEFLGFILDTKKETVEIPTEKWERVQSTIGEIRKSKTVSFKELEKLQGTLCSFLVVITNMQLYIRRITEKMKNMNLKNEMESRVDDRLDEELEIWQDLSKNAIKLERPWIKGTPLIVETKISTDASSSNGGWVEPDGTERTIPWTEEEAKLHITLKEALIIRKYLEQTRVQNANKRITFLCDNEGVVKTFEKGSKDPALNDEIRAIRLLGCEINCLLNIEWVSTKDQLADKASRTIDIQEEILITEVFKKLESVNGIRCEIDLCATFANKKCERYYSRFKEEGAEGQDAFTYTGQELVYAFPPKSLANSLFIKLIQNKVKFLGIYHQYQEQPMWRSLAPIGTKITRIDESWLKKNNIKREHPTLIPCKKRRAPEGYYEHPKTNLGIGAVLIQDY